MSKQELTKKQQKELQKLADDMVNDAKNVVKDYKTNPSELSSNEYVEFHEDSPYLMEREERLKSPISTSGSADVISFKIHEL